MESWESSLASLNTAIQGAANTIASYSTRDFNYETTKKLMNKSLAQQKDYYDYTFDKNAQYNHPSEQVARLKQAGLNPNLVYGGVQNVAQGSSGGSSTPMFQSQPANFDGQFSEIEQLRQSELYNKSQIDYQRSQADYQRSLTTKQMIENSYLAEKYGDDKVKRLVALEFDKLQADVDNSVVGKGLLMQQIAESVAREHNFNAQSSLYLLQGITEAKRPDLLMKQIQDYDSQISNREYYNSYLVASAELAGANEEQIRAITKKLPDFQEKELEHLASEIWKNYHPLVTKSETHKLGPLSDSRTITAPFDHDRLIDMYNLIMEYSKKNK